MHQLFDSNFISQANWLQREQIMICYVLRKKISDIFFIKQKKKKLEKICVAIKNL